MPYPVIIFFLFIRLLHRQKLYHNYLELPELMIKKAIE